MICERCGSEVATHGKCGGCTYLDDVLEYRHAMVDYAFGETDQIPLPPMLEPADEVWQVWHTSLGRWVLSEALTQYQAEEHARALVHKHGGEGRCRKLVPGAPIPVEGPHVHSWHNNLGHWFCVDCGERKP